MTAEKQRVLYCDLFTDSCRFCVDSVNLKREGERVRGFLSYALNAQEYPVSVLETPIESETCKVVENSYRATILAFLHEWSVFAERNDMDIIKVIEAIKVSPTHSNITLPGQGREGYCLPKDGGFGIWAYQTLLGVRRRHIQDNLPSDRHKRYKSASSLSSDRRCTAKHGENRLGP